MKLRLEENSVRFRLSETELEELFADGRVESITEILSEETGMPEGRFVYGVASAGEGDAEACLIQPSYILLLLHAATIAHLHENPAESVYIRHEVPRHDGSVHRFMAYLEVDKPTKHKKRPENWLDTGEGEAERA